MPLPQIDTQKFVDELNSLRNSGKVIRDDLRVAKMRKIIDAVKRESVMAHFAYLGSLLMVTGKYDAALDAVKKSLSSVDVADRLPYNINTLLVAGFFSEAAQYANRISDDEISVEGIAADCVLNVLDFRRALLVSKHAELAKDALTVLKERGVSSSDVLPMLDLAGALLRERGLLANAGPSFFVYMADRTMTIHVPVNQSPDEVAELEWEYSARLFNYLPDAPHSFVHIGFCSNGQING